MTQRGRHGRDLSSGLAAAATAPGAYTRSRWPNATRTIVLGVEMGATPTTDQGGLATARADESPGPDRRRPGRVAGSPPGGWPRSTTPTRRSRASRTGRVTAARRTRTAHRSSAGVVRRRGGPPGPQADPARSPAGSTRARPIRPRNQTVGHGAGRRRCAVSRRFGPTWSGREPPRASTPTGPLRPRSTPALPPAQAGPAARRGAGDHHDVRQVPRPHARPDRGVRAVVHRLGRRHGHPRSGPGECGPGH